MNDFEYPWCSKCHDSFPMRRDDYENLKECGNTFYCPQGHALVITRASIVSQLRIAERRVKDKTSIISRLLKRVESLRGVQTRQRNRLLRGACLYCNLTSKDIIKHIQERHKP